MRDLSATSVAAAPAGRGFSDASPQREVSPVLAESCRSRDGRFQWVGMTDRESLLCAALDQPADDTSRLVLADFLREQPDPGDVALGRFLWAGVVASRYRSANVIEDAEFYTALAELSAVASDGWPARWLSSLGLGPSPLAPGDWAWDNVGDRLTVRVGRVTGEFERDMLAGLTVTRAGGEANAEDY